LIKPRPPTTAKSTPIGIRALKSTPLFSSLLFSLFSSRHDVPRRKKSTMASEKSGVKAWCVRFGRIRPIDGCMAQAGTRRPVSVSSPDSSGDALSDLFPCVHETAVVGTGRTGGHAERHDGPTRVLSAGSKYRPSVERTPATRSLAGAPARR